MQEMNEPCLFPLAWEYWGTESLGVESFMYEWKEELNNLCINIYSYGQV